MNRLEKFKLWWDGLSTRDQLALGIGGICLLLYILFMGVLKPLADMRDDQIRFNEVRIGELAKVRELVEIYKNRNTQQTGNQRSIIEVTESSLRRHGLRLSNMQPTGRSDVRIRLDSVPFDNLLAWLYEMEIDEGMQVRDLTVAAGSNPGMVAVTLRLHQE